MLHADTAFDPTPEPTHLLDAQAETLRFAEHTALWHLAEQDVLEDDLLLRLHRSNFELWHLEDEARDTEATDAVIAKVKRSIDKTNQRRNDLVEIKLFVLALLVQQQTGGNLAELLDKLSGLLRERFRIRGVVQTLTAEGRMQAIILMGLPPVIFLGMLVLNRPYAVQLFKHPKLIAATLVSEGIGALWIRKIVNFEY